MYARSSAIRLPAIPACVAALLLPAVAWAEIDPKCAGLSKPADYDEQVQQDFLANFFALSTTMSPVHAPIPHEAGHGAIGLDLLVIPPLSCQRRYVLDFTKTEDTNKAPMAPRPRLTFALDGPGEVVLYGGVGYVPPVTIFGTRNVILSGEIGVGVPIGEKLQVGGRFHATSMRSIADIATGFEPTDPVVLDYYNATTLGIDGMVGFDLGKVTPYAAIGALDASTFFLVGDNGYLSNNFHPYAGLAFSAGADALIAEKLRLGGEFYGAPGGHSLPDPEATDVDGYGRYGKLYTARIRVGLEL